MQRNLKIAFFMLVTTTVLLFTIFGNERVANFLPFVEIFQFKKLKLLTDWNVRLDLTAEFQDMMENNPILDDVFQALKEDGYVLSSVSAVERSDNFLSAEKKYNSNEKNGTNETNGTKVSQLDTRSHRFKVPNVVHYVFLGSDLHFTFVNYLSYRSVERFIKPDQIFVHGDHVPAGLWWNRTIQEVHNIYHVKREYSKKAPNGKDYRYPAHISDYVRTEILLRYGGIYLDADVMVVKSFTTLRQYPVVMGREAPDALCNGIILATRGAPFLRLLLEQYNSYNGPTEIWAEKSVVNSNKLALLYPHLLHIEETSLNRPNWIERAQIYDGRYDWTKNYAVHLWLRLWPQEKKPNGLEDIRNKATTFGEIGRLIISGSPEVNQIQYTTTNTMMNQTQYTTTNTMMNRKQYTTTNTMPRLITNSTEKMKTNSSSR